MIELSNNIKTYETTYTKSKNNTMPSSLFRSVCTYKSQNKGEAIFYMHFDKVFSYMLIVGPTLHSKPSGKGTWDLTFFMSTKTGRVSPEVEQL